MKKKFIFAWFVSIIVPILLIGTMHFFQVNIFNHGFTSTFDQIIDEAFQLEKLSSVEEASRKINLNTINNKESLIEIFELVENRDANIGFILRKDNKIIYKTSFVEKVDEEDLDLPAYNSVEAYNNKEYSKKYDFVIDRQIDFERDGHQLSVFILKNIKKVNPFIGQIIGNFLLFSFVLLIFITIIKYKVAKSIIKPIDALIDMTKKVRNGELDVSLDSDNSDNKLSELINAFNQMVESLRKSEKLREVYDQNQKEFIMNITHDLKTPITSIKIHVEALKDGIVTTEEKRDKYFNNIIKKTKDIDYLINEITLYSELNLKRMAFNLNIVPMVKVFNEMIEEIKLEYDVKPIDIKKSIYIEENTRVLMDVDKIKRVLLNMIENAIKYSKADPLILDISVADYSKNRVKISVSDNGVGVSTDKLNKIFERTYREDQSRSKSGSGLGLSIASEIIKNHNGEIWASCKEGKGLTVSFTLEKGRKFIEENINYRR